MKICKAPNCYKQCLNGYCNTCRSRIWRSKNPMRASFNAKKYNAKRDGIPFHLTFKQYVAWGKENNYFDTKGQCPDDTCIDRIKTMDDAGNVLGYVVGNIQLLTMAANGLKGQGERRCEFFKRQYAPRMPGDPF